jgi:hypothetical protein
MNEGRQNWIAAPRAASRMQPNWRMPRAGEVSARGKTRFLCAVARRGNTFYLLQLGQQTRHKCGSF